MTERPAYAPSPKRRLDPAQDPYRLLWASEINSLYVCPRCGAVVAAPATHQDWHLAMAEDAGIPNGT